jgi:hypothetical protein
MAKPNRWTAEKRYEIVKEALSPNFEQFRNRRARAFPAAETLFAKVCGRMVYSLFGFWFLAFKLKSPPGKEESEAGKRFTEDQRIAV